MLRCPATLPAGICEARGDHPAERGFGRSEVVEVQGAVQNVQRPARGHPDGPRLDRDARPGQRETRPRRAGRRLSDLPLTFFTRSWSPALLKEGWIERARFTEKQIIGILRENEVKAKAGVRWTSCTTSSQAAGGSGCSTWSMTGHARG